MPRRYSKRSNGRKRQSKTYRKRSYKRKGRTYMRKGASKRFNKSRGYRSYGIRRRVGRNVRRGSGSSIKKIQKALIRANNPVNNIIRTQYHMVNRNTSEENGNLLTLDINSVDTIEGALTDFWQQSTKAIPYRPVSSGVTRATQNDFYTGGDTSQGTSNALSNRNSAWSMRGYWQNKIMWHGETDVITLSNQQNTYCDVEYWMIKPKKDIPWIRGADDFTGSENPVVEEYLQVVNNVLSLTSQQFWAFCILKQTDASYWADGTEFQTWVQHVLHNVNWKPTDFHLFCQYYTIYKHKKLRINVGHEHKFTFSRVTKAGKELAGPHLAKTLADKFFTRYLIIKTNGQLINDVNGQVGYSDTNLAVKQERKISFRQVPTTFKYLPRYPDNPGLPGEFFVMNPVSGTCENEIDTSQGPSIVNNLWPNTGLPVYVTNGAFNRIPVSSIPGVPLADNSELEESFKSL